MRLSAVHWRRLTNIGIVCVFFVGLGCNPPPPAPDPKSEPAPVVEKEKKEPPVEVDLNVERDFPPYFLEHRKLFTEKSGVYKSGDYPIWTVHAPGGWGGNLIVIEGKTGLIVYDVCIAREGAELAMKEIRKITDKPVVAVFYSHHHPDHYNGTDAVVSREDVQSGKVPIYAWANFEEEKANEFGEIINRQAMGAAYYSGALLPPEDKHYHSCCGEKMVGGTSGYIAPTKTFDKDTKLTIAGVKMNVFYTGGEAISEFGLYLPDYKTVIIADEFFYSLPNLHSIRGSKPRIPDNYIAALDRVRELEPEWLLGSHIMPIQGKEKINELVTKSRDAIQYLWDQAIRYINKGYTPAELQHKFRKMPDYLDLAPYTRPMYGTPWIITPEFFTGWVSWFNGDATDLLPTEPVKKARRYVELMGGRDKVLNEAKKAFNNDDPQFAAELTQLLVRIDKSDEEAKKLKAAALRKRGYAEMNSIARSWYLTGALELEGKVKPKQVLATLMASLADEQIPAAKIFRFWRYFVNAEAAGKTRLTLGFEITDTKEKISVELRNSILEVRIGAIPPEAAAVVELDTPTLNKINLGQATFDDVTVTGDATAPAKLLSYLDRELPEIYMHIR